PPSIDDRPLAERGDGRLEVFDQLKNYWKDVQASYNDYVSVHQKYYDSYQGEANDSLRFSRLIERVERALALVTDIDLSTSAQVTVAPNSRGLLSLKISNHSSQPAEVLGCFSCEQGKVCRQKPAAITWNLSSPSRLNPKVKRNSVLPAGEMSGSASFQLSDQTMINVPLASHLYQPNALGSEINTLCSIQVADTTFRLKGSTRVDTAPAVEIAFLSPSLITVTPATANLPVTFLADVINNDSQEHIGQLVATR